MLNKHFCVLVFFPRYPRNHSISVHGEPFLLMLAWYSLHVDMGAIVHAVDTQAVSALRNNAAMNTLVHKQRNEIRARYVFAYY